MTADVDAWMSALLERHVQPLGKPAFLKAVRALSARYVERRDQLANRSPIDSAGKRAAFAGFFAPMHFMTTHAIVQLMKLNESRIETIVDLGCGTGVAGAAWALAQAARPALTGVDQHPWAVEETKWNWRTLGLAGRARRGDLVEACVRLRQASRRSSSRGTAIVLAWAVNELSDDARRALLPLLLDLAREGASVLVIEPVARRAAPWWDEWAATFGEARGVAEEWPVGIDLKPPFDELDRAAGFRRESLNARSLSIRGSGT
jgi:Methyltransferase small domain